MYDFFAVVIKSFEAQGPNDIRGHYATRSKVLLFRRRKWIFGDPPKGYEEWRGWIRKIPGWDLVIPRIFELYLMYRKYTVVTKKINEEFKAFLKEPISRQQITAILENPVYVGRPRFGGDVVEKDFGDVEVNDPSLIMVPDDLFEKVQAIIQDKKAHSPRRQESVKELVETFGFDILDFLPYVKVHCRHCDGVMRSGGGSDYVCTKCGRHLVPVDKKQLQKILEYFFKREKDFQVLRKLLKKYKLKHKGKKLVELLERKFLNNEKKESRKNEEKNVNSSAEKKSEEMH
jgi:transposase-like protein